MSTWTGTIGPGTHAATGRKIYLDWTIESSPATADYNTTAVSWRLVIVARTTGSTSDSNNSFTISGNWSRSGPVTVNITSVASGGTGTQQIYDSGWGNTDSVGWGSTSSKSFTASISNITAQTGGGDYPAISGSGSGSVTIDTPTPPSAPGISVNTLGNGYVDFSYSAPSNGGTGGVSYYQYSSDNSNWTNNPANPFRINGTNGTTVYGYVRAVNAYGQAGPSAGTSGIPRTVPTAPTSLAANTSTFGTIGLSWSAPSSNGGNAITGYVVKRDGVQKYSGTALTFNDTTVAPAVQYTYTVIATNAAGNSTEATITVTSLGGVVNVKKSTTGYDKVLPQVRVNGAWVKAQARVRSNNEWKYGI